MPQPTGAGAGSNKAQKAVVNKKAKGKKADDDDDEVSSRGPSLLSSTSAASAPERAMDTATPRQTSP